MATLADIIEQYLKQRLARTEGDVIEIRRRDVAQRFECVPSQINYVLETRFTPLHGYYVESRRGGGGYIRITRAWVRSTVTTFRSISQEIGSAICAERADGLIYRLIETGVLNERKGSLIRAALRQEMSGIDSPLNEVVRAKLLRGMLMVALDEQRKGYHESKS